MYPLIRVDKRIPDGSIWQTRRAYRLPDVDGWVRVYGPTGTFWSNPLGGWATEHPGISLFHPERPFTISCHGPAAAKRFYVDIMHRFRATPELVEFFDLFLDVMVDASGAVSEKDEHQLAALSPELRTFACDARDEVRRRIGARDPLFDSATPFYRLPNDAAVLAPARDPIALD